MNKFSYRLLYTNFRQSKMIDKAKITSLGIPKYMKKVEQPSKEVLDMNQVSVFVAPALANAT